MNIFFGFYFIFSKNFLFHKKILEEYDKSWKGIDGRNILVHDYLIVEIKTTENIQEKKWRKKLGSKWKRGGKIKK